MWNTINDVLGPTIFHPQYFAREGEYACIEEVRKRARGTFLDIGCGRQWYRRELQPLFKKYIALDHPVLKEQYKSTYPVEIESDVEIIPLSAKSVDIAMMNLVIEHIPDPEKALQEVKRVLKRGGFFIIYFVENYPVHGEIPYTYQHFTDRGFEKLLAEKGFSVKKRLRFGNFWKTHITYKNVFMMDMIKKNLRKNIIIGLFLFVFFAPFIILGNLAAYVLGRSRTRDFAIGHVFVVQA